MRMKGICVAVVASIVVLAWLMVGHRQVVEAQVPGELLTIGGEWVMFSQTVSGGGQSNLGENGVTWIYNTKTGATYKVWIRCGDDIAQGCLERLPVVGSSSASSFGFTPSAEPVLDRGTVY